MSKILLAAAVLAAVPAGAQQTLQLAPAVTTLSVSAEGRSLRAPDVVDLSGGVITTAATAAQAMAFNATRMTAVVAAIRRAGVAERDIQTAGLNLQPQYKYADNQPPLLTGYQASNTVSLRLRKIDQAGKLLDTLVGAGANSISGPNFRVDAADAALDEARTQAVATARSRAELYARAAGLKIKRILTISESGGDQPRPMPMMMARSMKMEAADTPVVPGEVTLSITVNVTFELE
ncbi:SIMPL domain-containing protein [Glacieibacterium sp.]|uniref:SIMPL domain-containing protein n=1 Tax=Glacieibacterium sp. TaxID=2860237 RepID=UPI003AFFFDCB